MAHPSVPSNLLKQQQQRHSWNTMLYPGTSVSSAEQREGGEQLKSLRLFMEKCGNRDPFSVTGRDTILQYLKGVK